MALREKDMAKLASIIDLLIDENKYLRDHIVYKNKYFFLVSYDNFSGILQRSWNQVD